MNFVQSSADARDARECCLGIAHEAEEINDLMRLGYAPNASSISMP